MSKKHDVRCETCRFWSGDDGGVPTCRIEPPRHPPARWPKALANDHCGSWSLGPRDALALEYHTDPTKHERIRRVLDADDPTRAPAW